MIESTVRSLPLRHMEKAVQTRRPGPDPQRPELGPDQIQLYSYYKPGLSAGSYVIEAVQEIVSTSENASRAKLRVTNVRENDKQKLAPQPFQVVVPRFNIDKDAVNSFYPPEGHQDEGRILPHIVFNDPYLPWQIEAGQTDRLHGTIDRDSAMQQDRNMVPWIALFVFDPEELRLDSTDMAKLKLTGSVEQQNMNGTFTMPVKDYFGRVPKQSQINFDASVGASSNESVDIIFPKKQLFSDLFQAGNERPEGNETPEFMKYLTHVRNINTVGFPDAGVEENGLFSIVISSRTGKYAIDSPQTQVCHLVSIENVDATLGGVRQWLKSGSSTESDRIGMISLYTWVYTSLPPKPINFVATMENLLRNQQMLRAPDPSLKELKLAAERQGGDAVEKEASRMLFQRLSMGYVPARWRAETGEETAAINRGPLVPLPVPQPPTADLPDCSNTSKEFQVFDKSSGLMDLSYSSAWQLGKTLAISDTAFSAALMRFRSSLANTSASLTRKELNQVDSEGALIGSLDGSVSVVRRIARGETSDPQRLAQTGTTMPNVDVKGTVQAREIYEENLNTRANSQAGAGNEPYNEFNVAAPNDHDWAVIHTWIMDKLFLADIPPQQLFPDPSFVPTEALRYFFIDDFWLDCLIDGALSLANHLDGEDDSIRVQIKQKLNIYFSSIVKDSDIKPQIPCYGFVLRSSLVKVMPDLRITVKWKPDDPKRQDVCRWTRYDDTTIIALLDRMPEQLDSITLSQPPHQQRFSLGANLDVNSNLTFVLRQLYTNDAAIPANGEWPSKKTYAGNETRPWFNSATRCIRMARMASDINRLLQDPSPLPQQPKGQPPETWPKYLDGIPNSCELALELNDPSYYFKIVPPVLDPPPSAPPAERTRQIYINIDENHRRAVRLNPERHPSLVAMARMKANGGVADSSSAEILSSSEGLNEETGINARALTASSITATPAGSSGTGTSASTGTGTGATAGTGTSTGGGSATVDLSLSLFKPPHIQTRIQVLPPALLKQRELPATPSGPLNILSQYELAIYPDYAPYPPPRALLSGYDPKSYIPTKNLYFFDLLLSLRRKTLLQGANPTLQLLDIQLDIPHDVTDATTGQPRPPARPSDEPLLLANYDGPGVRMLNNVRFVPFLYKLPDRLTVRLVPRAAADDVRMPMNDGKTKDLGFRLAEANVAPTRAASTVVVNGEGIVQRGEVTVTLVERYWTNVGAWPVVSQVKVLKKEVQDDS